MMTSFSLVCLCVAAALPSCCVGTSSDSDSDSGSGGGTGGGLNIIEEILDWLCETKNIAIVVLSVVVFILGCLLVCMCCLWIFKRRKSIIYKVVDVNRLDSEGGVEMLDNPWATDGEESATGQAEAERSVTELELNATQANNTTVIEHNQETSGLSGTVMEETESVTVQSSPTQGQEQKHRTKPDETQDKSNMEESADKRYMEGTPDTNRDDHEGISLDVKEEGSSSDMKQDEGYMDGLPSLDLSLDWSADLDFGNVSLSLSEISDIA